MEFHGERKRRLWVRREQGESGRKLDRAQTFPKIRQSELRDNVALELWNCNDNIFLKNVHIFVITQSKLRKNPENVGDGVNSSKPKCNKISVWKWGDYKSKCSMLMVASKMVDTDRYRRRNTISWKRRKWTRRITVISVNMPTPACKRGHNYGKSFPSIFWEFFLTFGS